MALELRRASGRCHAVRATRPLLPARACASARCRDDAPRLASPQPDAGDGLPADATPAPAPSPPRMPT